MPRHRHRLRRRLVSTTACLLLAAIPALARAQPVLQTVAAQGSARLAATTDLSEMSLEQLGNIEVTSVTRREERLLSTAASVFVLTSEDIRRSGAKTLPEVLRLVPTLQVARADANQYAISARGFNSVLANKMLVMIDGRAVYSPLFSGVFWEAQDLMLEDIERIEVVSGPGGTSWGTNAVNGMIHILTRTADDTKGVLASGGGGTDLRAGEARVGWGSRPSVRVYAKALDMDHNVLTNGTPVRDESDRFQTGARVRWTGRAHTFILDGGGYSNRIGHAPEERTVSGWHALGRWTREPLHGSRLLLQAFYDHALRDQPGTIFDRLDTWDVEFHHEFEVGPHSVVWGVGHRLQPDRVNNLSPGFALLPAARDLRYSQAFLEDVVRLRERLHLTGGVRFEHNDWTRWEYLPSVRLAFQPTTTHLLWAGASRAVRAPARVDREFFAPAAAPHLLLNGGPDFESEILDAGELGYRAQPHPALSYALTAFAGRYDKLRSLEPTPSGRQFRNGIDGTVHGVEGWANYRVMAAWRLSAGGVLQRRALFVKSGVTDINGLTTAGNDPDHWWTARSSFDVGSFGEIDLMARHVGALPNPAVPNYTTLDARVGAHMGLLEASLTGYNVVGPRHAEWGAPANRATFGQSWYAELQVRM